MSDTIRRTGSCCAAACSSRSAVRRSALVFAIARIGRKTGGSTYSAFAIWPREAFERRASSAPMAARSFWQYLRRPRRLGRRQRG